MTDSAFIPAPPGTASLHDFEPLLLAELIVLRAAANGDIAKVGYRRPRSPTPDVRLRAEFLAFLAGGGDDDTPVAGRRLQIMGACIIGRLQLAGAVLPMSLWFYRCTFGAVPVLEGARVLGGLSFSDCALPGLRAEGCRVDGDLALGAGCSIDGEVQLARSVISRDLNCERLRMRSDGQTARSLRRMFVADGALIGGDVILEGGVEATGEMRLVATQIGGALRLGTARLTADVDEQGARGVALNLDRVRVGGDVTLNAGFSAAGTVRLQQARIRGNLDCSGADFDVVGDASWGVNGSALRLDRARIGGALILTRLQGPLQGASLADAQVGSLRDDAGTWGQHHVLDGFSYTRFEGDAPTDAPTRLAWLTRQEPAHLDLDYRPDPWRRVQRVLRRSGHAHSAAEFAIGRERHLRRTGRVGQSAPPALRWLARLGHDAWGMFSGYGHRPLRLLATATLVWLLCGSAYWAAAERGGFATAPGWSAGDARLAACRPDCARLPPGVPAFQSFVYSLDVLLPLVELRQARHWVPARDALAPEVEAWSGVPLLQWLMWFEAACGWALALTAIAGLLRLGDRDRDIS